MKRQLIVIALCVISMAAFSQKIKIKVDEVDEFTGQRIIKTSHFPLSSNKDMGLGCRVTKIDNHYFITTSYTNSSMQLFSIRKDENMSIKLDSTVYNIDAIKMFHSKSNKIAGYRIHNITAIYSIKVDVIEEILKSNTMKVRVYSSSGFTSGDVKEKDLNNLKKAFRLVMEQ